MMYARKNDSQIEKQSIRESAERTPFYLNGSIHQGSIATFGGSHEIDHLKDGLISTGRVRSGQVITG